MINLASVLICAFFGITAIIFAGKKYWWSALANAAASVLFLIGISYSAGYPTNNSVPDHMVVYDVTNDYIWAAPFEQPYPPRSYQFKSPPQFFEERNKRKGQPFEVKRGKIKEGEGNGGIPGEKGDKALPGGTGGERSAGDGWVIVDVTLPPKG